MYKAKVPYFKPAKSRLNSKGKSIDSIFLNYRNYRVVWQSIALQLLVCLLWDSFVTQTGLVWAMGRREKTKGPCHSCSGAWVFLFVTPCCYPFQHSFSFSKSLNGCKSARFQMNLYHMFRNFNTVIYFLYVICKYVSIE